MKKKTFIVQLLDSKKPSRTSFTQVEDALFYSNDTDASLVFIPHEDSFDFESAKVVMFNLGDESLVERDMEVATEDGRKVASYELPDEIISHWGEWVAQPVFSSGGEIYSGAIVPFSVERHLMHERPPKLTEVVTVTKFVEQSQELVNAMIQAEAQRITEEQVRQDSETNRVQAESERSVKYESYAQQFNDVITDLSEEKDYHSLPEISAARGGHDTLGARLDETTAQLAQKVGGGKKAELEDLSSNVLGAIEGGEGTSFNLLSIPQDKSVTYKKISDTLLNDFNGFELNTLHNSSVTHNIKGSEIDVSNIDISGKEIKVTFEFITKTENLSAIRASVWQQSSGQQRNINQSPATTPILDETVSFTYSFMPTENRDTLTLFLNLTVPTQGSFSHSYIRNIFVNVGGTPYEVESLTPSNLAPESSITFIESLPTQLATVKKLNESLSNLIIDESPNKIDPYFEGRTVMTFGDSLTWYDGNPFASTHKDAGQIAKGYQSYLKEELGVNIINKGGSGYRLADNILGLIKDADYTGVDYVTITSGANDGRANKTVGELQSIGSNFDETTYIGALQSAIEHIYSVNNKIKIFLLTPVKGWQDNLGEVTEPYANAILKVSDLYSLPVCDWHYGSGINEVNKNYYMGDKRPDTNYDLHPINAGFENMGRMLVATFKSH